MTVEELAQACAKQVNMGSTAVALILPGVNRGSLRRRLPGCRSGPLGQVVSEGTRDDPKSVVLFKPLEVLAFLAAKGLVKVEGAPRE